MLPVKLAVCVALLPAPAKPATKPTVFDGVREILFAMVTVVGDALLELLLIEDSVPSKVIVPLPRAPVTLALSRTRPPRESPAENVLAPPSVRLPNPVPVRVKKTGLVAEMELLI